MKNRFLVFALFLLVGIVIILAILFLKSQKLSNAGSILNTSNPVNSANSNRVSVPLNQHDLVIATQKNNFAQLDQIGDISLNIMKLTSIQTKSITYPGSTQQFNVTELQFQYLIGGSPKTITLGVIFPIYYDDLGFTLPYNLTPKLITNEYYNINGKFLKPDTDLSTDQKKLFCFDKFQYNFDCPDAMNVFGTNRYTDSSLKDKIQNNNGNLNLGLQDLMIWTINKVNK